MHQSFLPLCCRGTRVIQTDATEQDKNLTVTSSSGIFDTEKKKVVASAKRGKKADTFINGYQRLVQF